MRHIVIISIVAALMTILLASCVGAQTPPTVMEMELTANYDDSDPFVNEKLFFVNDNADILDFDVSFKMKAGSGLLEIADNETKEVIWSKSWSESADEKFSFSLSGLDKEKEYVIRLTCSKVEYAKLKLTSDSSLVKELEKPRK